MFRLHASAPPAREAETRSAAPFAGPVSLARDAAAHAQSLRAAQSWFAPQGARRGARARRQASVACAAILFVASATGCVPQSGSDVVVYTALDAEFSSPVFSRFEKETKVAVRPKFDTESTKTVGLTQAIIAESNRPQCDVFWNNEILNTLRLQRMGLLAAYRSPAAEAIPAMYRSPEGEWCGFAARARVLIVNTKLLSEHERPRSIRDLADAKWKARCGIAKPLFGTTATHVACLFAAWGADKAKEFLSQVKANEAQILSGNKQVALSVAAGRLAFGLTDTDDALSEIEAGRPVAIVYPDQGENGMGTLFIPNTVAILRGAPHEEAAKKLVDFLLSPGVEAELAEGPSGQIPLNPNVKLKLRVETPATIKAMQVDFAQAAAEWERAGEFLRLTFAE